MYRIWSNKGDRFLFPNIAGKTYEEVKDKFRSKLRRLVEDRVIIELENRDGYASPRKIKDIVDVMTFEEMLRYCDYEIRQPFERCGDCDYEYRWKYCPKCWADETL